MDIDKDYIKYLVADGKLTKEDAILDYLAYITDCLHIIMEKSPDKSLVGQYMLPSQNGGKGARKGPPPVII